MDDDDDREEMDDDEFEGVADNHEAEAAKTNEKAAKSVRMAITGVHNTAAWQHYCWHAESYCLQPAAEGAHTMEQVVCRGTSRHHATCGV